MMNDELDLGVVVMKGGGSNSQEYNYNLRVSYEALRHCLLIGYDLSYRMIHANDDNFTEIGLIGESRRIGA